MHYPNMKTILYILLLLTFNACKKEPQKNPIVDGSYSGLLTSETYVTFSGQTTVDTLDANFKIDLVYNEGNKTLQLNSTNALLNGLLLNEITITDSLNLHYGNNKVFELTITNPNWRYYYLHYNQISGKDNIYLKTYQAPGGGWNQSEVFTGVK